MPDPCGTIVAEATPPGRGAVRVVRLSGPSSLSILKALFHPLEDRLPWDNPRSLCLGRFLDRKGDVLDEGLAVFFAAPRSFTGEDAAEFQGHGSPAVVAGLTTACIALGARPALPGEFSFRAFLSGKLTVSEAEAVNALTACETGLQARAVAGSKLFEARVRRLRESLLDLAASWEARLDFPEELPPAGEPSLYGSLAPLLEELDALRADAEASRPLREGWRVALCGAPNVGKSSLFNALLQRERALVTPHPGTTRDVLEETLDLGGLPIVLLDTAGVRESDDPIESLGVARGRAVAADSDGILLLCDKGRGWGEAEESLRGLAGDRVVAVVETKADLARGGCARPRGALAVSCVTGEGLESLTARLFAWASASLPAGGGLLLSARQQAGLSRARSACSRAEEALAAGATEEVALVDLNECRASLEELLGEGDPEDLYNRIFSTFCIGK